jgi:hypothetical protein
MTLLLPYQWFTMMPSFKLRQQWLLTIREIMVSLSTEGNTWIQHLTRKLNEQNAKRQNFMFCWPASLYNLVNKANLAHNFSSYVYFFSLHVSGDYVPIIRWNSYIYAILRTFYSMVCRVKWNIPPCIPDSHPYRITSIKCRKNIIVSPDDGHIVARNM